MTKKLKEGEHVDLDSGATIERMQGDPNTYCLTKYNPHERRSEYVFVSREDLRHFAEHAGFRVTEK